MGARIKELRASRGLKQQFIADHCGVTLRTFQMWQAGDTEPRQEQLEKLADILETTPRFILRGETPDLSLEGRGSQLDRIEQKLDTILGYWQGANVDSVQQAIAYLNQIVQAAEKVGLRDEQRPASTGRSRRPPRAAA